jgi:hypothetical protein
MYDQEIQSVDLDSASSTTAALGAPTVFRLNALPWYLYVLDAQPACGKYGPERRAPTEGRGKVQQGNQFVKYWVDNPHPDRGPYPNEYSRLQGKSPATTFDLSDPRFNAGKSQYETTSQYETMRALRSLRIELSICWESELGTPDSIIGTFLWLAKGCHYRMGDVSVRAVANDR